MQLRRYNEPGDYYHAAKAFLLQHEAEHNLIIGLASRLMQGGLPQYTNPYMAVVTDDAGEMAAVALMTPPHNLLLSRVLDDRACDYIASDLRERFPLLPGITASVPYARSFAEAWQRASGQRYTLKMPQRIYQLEQVKMPQGVSGELRPAEAEHRELLIQWLMAFENEAIEENDDAEMQRSTAERMVDQKLTSPLHTNTLYLWHDPEPVAMVACAGPTPNGIRVNAVYTPPEHRRRGYASAATAALSEILREQGRKFCFLYTDLGNSTSNHIYQEIGYTPVCDVEYLAFDIED
jgi:uncharacterized protein